MAYLLIAFFIIAAPLCSGETPISIGIAGGTGSGKSTLADKLKTSLAPNVVLVEQDAYYKDLSHLSMQEREEWNFDHPNSIDFNRLCIDIMTLKRGEAIERPIYNFKSHTRERHTIRIEPADVILIEGILVLAEEKVRQLLDLKLYVETDDDIRILRRIERDIQERGRDLSSIHHQYISTVKPMHSQFVEPSKQFADVIIPGGSDTAAALTLILDGLRSREK